MPAEDIAKLKIEKSEKIAGPAGAKRNPLSLRPISPAAFRSGGLYFGGIIAPATSVDVTTISQVYPSQSLSILNASGYIVAQRKAAVASKVTGRLVALMVEEGSKVKQGQVIARMENVDVTAFRDQAAANLNTVGQLWNRPRRKGTMPCRSMTVIKNCWRRISFPSPITMWIRATKARP